VNISLSFQLITVVRLMAVVLMLTFSFVSCEGKKEPTPDIPLGQDTPRPEQAQQRESIPEKAMDNIIDRTKQALPDKNNSMPEKSTDEKSTADRTTRAEAGGNLGGKAAEMPNAGEMSEAKAGKSPHEAKKQGEKRKHQVVVSQEVKNRWEAVRLAITDKRTKKTQAAVVALGGTYRIPDSELTIKAGDFIPDFKVDALSVTSVSNQPNNPAVSITIFQDGTEIFDGWLFEKYPEVHSFEHERYAVALKKGVEKNSKPEKEKNLKPAATAVTKTDEKTIEKNNVEKKNVEGKNIEEKKVEKNKPKVAKKKHKAKKTKPKKATKKKSRKSVKQAVGNDNEK